MLNLFQKKAKSKKPQDPRQGYDEMDILNKEEVYQEGLTRILDFIAPSALGVNSSYLQIGESYCRTIFISAYPRVLPIGWMNRLVNVDLPMDISFFVHPVDTVKVVKNLRKKVAQIQSQIKIEAEKGLARDPELEMAYRNVEDLRDKLQEGVEKVFKFGLYVNVYAKNLDDLEKNTDTLESILESMSIFAKKAVFRMKEGFDSCLPLNSDKLMIGTDLNTSPLATAFPFISSNVTSNEGIMYGINKHNNSLILFDRFSMENANTVVFAKSGAGKSYTIKLEVLRSLMLGVDSIIIDPEDEYRYLAEAVGGSYISVSLNSSHHINPFSLQANEDESMEEILRANAADLIGLFRLMLGNITPEEETVLERAIKEVYLIRDISEKSSIEDLNKKSMPLMSDFYEILKNMQGGESLAMRVEKYTQGIYKGFLNQPSNIVLKNRLIVFNLRDLEDELRPVAMYLILKYIWNEIRFNMKKRLITVDEAWWMMQHEDGAKFLFSIAKRIRKYYGGLTTITQDVSDFLGSTHGKAIVSNASIQLLMKQSQSSVDIVADTFYLTDKEKYFLMETQVGEGIFFAGNKRAAIQVVASYNEDKIITTNPAQRAEIEKES